MLCNNRISVFFNNSIIDTEIFEIIGQNFYGKIGLFLVEIDGENFKFDRRTFLHIE